MSWMQKLYDTYEQCAGVEPDVGEAIMPIAHVSQQAHIEIVVDENGNFRRAKVVPKETTIIPATEKSAGRTSGEAPHPLCDKIQYCGADYSGDAGFGGVKVSYFDSYLNQLRLWCESENGHPKAKAIYEYVRKRTLVKDLIESKVLVEKNGVLVELREVKGGKDGDPQAELHRQADIFKQLTAKEDGNEKVKDQGDALVRWRVEEVGAGNRSSATWEDKSLMESWIKYYASLQTGKGFCMVTGKNVPLAIQHPAKIRNAGDKTKLISTNDTSGYTYRGRFLSADESVSVGFEVSQKAHNALRWLIQRQGYRGDQAVVSWAVSGRNIPDMTWNSFEILGLEGVNFVTTEHVETGQAFALRLNKRIAGYRATLDPNEDVVVMVLDSTSGNNGRLSIAFYRELKGSEFLQRIESWHTECAWHQCYSKDKKFTGSPSPKDIAEAAYGEKIIKRDEKLRKATVERLLPCIIDGIPVPRDLVESTKRRACNRVGMELWEWEKCLGIACSLYKVFNKNRSYLMSLETDRTSRDYLYGRLLAIAEKIETIALAVAGEKRDTTAARLMQRFSDRPFSTWKTIELSLTPYKARLRSRRTGFLVNMEKLLDEVSNAFQPQDFVNDKPLSGEFLLGYHCQRMAFKPVDASNTEYEQVTDN